MRILEIETYGRGGLIHYTYNLSAALAARGHEVTLVTGATDELEAIGNPAVNADVVRLFARASNRYSESWPAIALNLLQKAEAILDGFALARLVRRLQPDVVHLHCTNKIALLYCTLLRLLGQPLVATAHIVTPHEPILFQNAIYRGIHRLATLVIAHSEADQSRLLAEFAVDPARVTVIPHGEYGFFEGTQGTVDREAARRSLGLDSHDEVALFFGYIRDYKGLDLLFEAWPEVVKSRPDARIVVAGDPVKLGASRRAEFEQWATRLGAVHRFEYIPFSDVSRYFAAADVLVMPYRHISQSGVLYLALSLGVPVVVTRVGGIPETLQDGDSALLIPPESTTDLAQALIRVLGDPALQNHLSQGGRRIAEAHSWPSITERTERAFQQLLSG